MFADIFVVFIITSIAVLHLFQISRRRLHILHGLYLLLVGLTVVDYQSDSKDLRTENEILLGLEIANVGLWSAVFWYQGCTDRCKDFHSTLKNKTLNGQLLCKFLFHIFGIMWMLQEYGSSNTMVEKTIQIVCVLMKEWLFCGILNMTKSDVNLLWKRLFLNEALCCIPPLVAQFVYRRYIGNSFTSITMSGELLVLAFG